ncbi:MAG: DUF4350 domain-containing protein [Burkholderiaceae bacterium]|nr:DUF4350 domain-containing protein [Microbacteriaceae bacterium]
MTTITPTIRQGLRRSLFWIGAVVLLLLVALGALAAIGGVTPTTPLSPENAATDGTRAVAEVLRQQGVDVQVTDSLDATTQAVIDPSATTIVMHDPDAILDAGQLDTLAGLATRLVLIDPGFAVLQELAPGIRSAGAPSDDPLEAACPAAAPSPTVSSGGTAYRTTESGAETCLLSRSDGVPDAYSLVRVDRDGTAVWVLGATAALTNGEVLDHDNAAFALTLLGEAPRLVWYLPSAADAATPDIQDITPGWLTPAIALLVATLLAAVLWRGRRFGPLIVENLPVTVRASETMEGRARLYQSSSARLRAIDAIRVGTIGRLATRCGLGSAASVDEVIAAVVAAVGGVEHDIRSILLDEIPETDAALVRLSARLAELETSVAASARR